MFKYFHSKLSIPTDILVIIAHKDYTPLNITTATEIQMHNQKKNLFKDGQLKPFLSEKCFTRWKIGAINRILWEQLEQDMPSLDAYDYNP